MYQIYDMWRHLLQTLEKIKLGEGRSSESKFIQDNKRIKTLNIKHHNEDTISLTYHKLSEKLLGSVNLFSSNIHFPRLRLAFLIELLCQ